jgi:hypothetical protein
VKGGFVNSDLAGRVKDLFLRHPLAVSLGLGLFFRLWCAVFNYTPVAEDDYANVIGPALQALQTGLPVHTVGYRLDIFPRIFHLFLLPFHSLGVTDPRVLVSIGYAALALVSLTGIWGMHKLGGNFLSAGWRALLTLLTAVYFLSPFLTTKCLLESFSMNAVPWAFYFLTKPRSRGRDYFWAALFLGLSVILRFQNSVLVIAAAAFLLVLAALRRIPGRAIAFFFLAGLASLLVLAGLDLASHRVPLSTLWNYVEYNFRGNVLESGYGRSSWTVYLGFFLCVFIPPFSLAFLWPFVRGVPRTWLVSTALFAYVLFHSLIANKLDRFMLPVVPLFFLITFVGMESSGILKRSKIVKAAWACFWALNCVLIFPACVSKSQTSIIDAALYLRGIDAPVYMKGVVLWKQGYRGYDRPEPRRVKDLPAFTAGLRGSGVKEFYFLNFLPLQAAETALFTARGYAVETVARFAPSLLESLVIKANPLRNKRRMATYLYRIALPESPAARPAP